MHVVPHSIYNVDGGRSTSSLYVKRVLYFGTPNEFIFSCALNTVLQLLSLA